MHQISLAGSSVCALGLLCLSAAGSAQAQTPPAPEPPPLETGVIESVRTRLAQVDITVSGPREQIDSLTADDFVLKIGLRTIREFKLDRFCGDVAGGDPLLGQADAAIGAGAAPATYLFYFDQPYLTLAGRQEALDLARGLVPEILRNGSRAMIVSNARALQVVAPLSSDPQSLRKALERLEDDRSQWDSWAEEEDDRVASVIDALNRRQDVAQATMLARVLQREERARADRDLRRLTATLWRLAPADPPKAVFYFADTMRANAGEHYLSFFGKRMQLSTDDLSRMNIDSGTATLSFDTLVNEAVALGVRFYNIKPSGLANPSDRRLVGMSGQEMAGAVSTPSSVRRNDTLKMLQSLSAETGGEAFVNGATPARVARQVRGDFECVFLASFDPSGILEDQPLRLKVKLRHPDLKAHARGRFVLQSARAQETARVLGEFLVADDDDAPGVTTNLVPTGFDGQRFTALLQIRIPPSAFAPAKWDIGASLVSRERVREETSGRIEISGRGLPVVLESALTLSPHPLEIVSVARESLTGLVLSDRSQIDWTQTPQAVGVVGPVHMLQPGPGAFLRDGESRRRGSLALGTAEPADTSLPTVFVGLVCRGRRNIDAVTVDRGLAGEIDLDFDPLEVDLSDRPCALVRDIFPPGSLLPGRYAYRIAVRSEGTDAVPVAAIREFEAVGPRPAAGPVAVPQPMGPEGR